MRSMVLSGIACTLALVAATSAEALSIRRWSDHAQPFDFRFDNAIDSHQETKQSRAGDLAGFFYVVFTGEVTRDGYRVATHVDCNTTRNCTVGWLLRGQPAEATLVSPEQGGHPLFSLPRAEIPQPGAYSHFHWLGDRPPVGESAEGYLLELVAVDRFCFVHHEDTRVAHGMSCADLGGLRVTPGIDVATHLNIIAE